MQFRPRGGLPKRFGSLAEYPATPWLEKSQGASPQPPITSQPRRTDSRSVRACVPCPPGADSPLQSRRRRMPAAGSIRRGGACRAGAHLGRPCTVRGRPAARPRRVADRPEAIRRSRPRMRSCGGWKAPGTPNRRIGAPPQRARRRKARPPAPPPGRGAGRIRRADFPKRIAATASCGRGCPITALQAGGA